jgi:hypothetical protein
MNPVEYANSRKINDSPQSGGGKGDEKEGRRNLVMG